VLSDPVHNVYCKGAATPWIFAPNSELHPSLIGEIHGDMLPIPRVFSTTPADLPKCSTHTAYLLLFHCLSIPTFPTDTLVCFGGNRGFRRLGDSSKAKDTRRIHVICLTCNETVFILPSESGVFPADFARVEAFVKRRLSHLGALYSTSARFGVRSEA